MSPRLLAVAHKDEAPGVTAEGFRDNGKVNRLDCAQEAAQRKRLTTLQAQLALKGHELSQRPDGGLQVGRWGLVRDLADLDAAEAFARLVGAQ